jgi:hypothetical protein
VSSLQEQFIQVSAMKIHLCFAIMFFQLAASLRQDAKSLRSRTAAVLDTPAGGAKPKADHDERDHYCCGSGSHTPANSLP